MQIKINQQKDNIIFRSVSLFFGVLIICFGLTLIFSNKEYLFGIVLLFAGILFTVYSIFLLKKWLVLLKTFKEEKKKKFFDDADNIVEHEIEVADFGGAKPSLTLRKSGNVYLIVECPPFYDGDGNEIDGNKDFPEAMEFEKLISDYIGVPVKREDREVFLIEKANIEIMRKVKSFIENYWELRKGKYKKQ